MILDCLSRADAYRPLHPSFAAAFAFLRRADLADLPPGRYEIAGPEAYAMISAGPGRRPEAAPLEAHREYIDVQYVIAGDEQMGWKPRADCGSASVAYDAAKDIEFFPDPPATWFHVHPGQFVIYFPADAHAPLVCAGEVRKVVVKIRN